MNNQEYQNIPEVQEQLAAENLARLYLNSSAGDVEKNIRAISATFVVKYQEAMTTDRGIDQSVIFDAQRAAKATRKRYSGIPKLLVDGVVHEGQEIKPSQAWLSNQAQKMKTFAEAMEILDTLPKADVVNLMIDTLIQVDTLRSESGETIGSALKTALDVSGSKLTVPDFQATVNEIESVMDSKVQEMISVEQSKDGESRRTKRDIEADVAYMVTRCIDYAIETYPARVLKRVERRLHSRMAKDVLSSMIGEFKSAGYYTLNSVYHQENPDFMDDIVNIVMQNDSLQIDNLIRIRAHVDRVLKN